MENKIFQIENKKIVKTITLDRNKENNIYGFCFKWDDKNYLLSLNSIGETRYGLQQTNKLNDQILICPQKSYEIKAHDFICESGVKKDAKLFLHCEANRYLVIGKIKISPNKNCWRCLFLPWPYKEQNERCIQFSSHLLR